MAQTCWNIAYCKCRTSFKWSKIHRLLVTGENNRLLAIQIFSRKTERFWWEKYWNLSKNSFEVLYTSWIGWCCQELDAVVLCRKRFTLLLVSSSDHDLLRFGGDEDSFTKLCSLPSTPLLMGVVVGRKICHEKTKSFCPASYKLSSLLLVLLLMLYILWELWVRGITGDFYKMKF